MLQYLATFYYTIPLQIALNITCTVKCLRHYSKIREMRWLLPYSVMALFQSVFRTYAEVYEPYLDEPAHMPEYTLNLFVLAEFIIFSLFILHGIQSRVIGMVLKPVMVLFSCFILYRWIFSGSLQKSPANFRVMEAYLVIVSCLFYYYDLFIHPPLKDLLKNARFWAVTGILFFFALTTPLFLQRNFLYPEPPPYTSGYMMTVIGYIILFSFFINAIKWKIRAVKQSP